MSGTAGAGGLLGGQWQPWQKINSSGFGASPLYRIGAATGPTLFLTPETSHGLPDGPAQAFYQTRLFAGDFNGGLWSSAVSISAAEPNPAPFVWSAVTPPAGVSNCQHVSVHQTANGFQLFGWFIGGTTTVNAFVNTWIQSADPLVGYWSGWQGVQTLVS